jgi:transcriptional regulator with XRE-family HTH domain
MSQKQVAQAMQTTQSAVSELEGGATDPRLSTLQRYARAVGAELTVHLRANLIGYHWLPRTVESRWDVPILAEPHSSTIGWTRIGHGTVYSSFPAEDSLSKTVIEPPKELGA